jgi:hypothetical protein
MTDYNFGSEGSGTKLLIRDELVCRHLVLNSTWSGDSELGSWITMSYTYALSKDAAGGTFHFAFFGNAITFTVSQLGYLIIYTH